jgi:hypothetical protein
VSSKRIKGKIITLGRMPQLFGSMIVFSTPFSIIVLYFFDNVSIKIEFVIISLAILAFSIGLFWFSITPNEFDSEFIYERSFFGNRKIKQFAEIQAVHCDEYFNRGFWLHPQFKIKFRDNSSIIVSEDMDGKKYIQKIIEYIIHVKGTAVLDEKATKEYQRVTRGGNA